MKIKIAQFRDTSGGYVFFRSEDSLKWKSSSDVQISEFVEVDFPMRHMAIAICHAAEEARAEAKTILENYEKSLKAVQNCDKVA
jgi:hypothetical protein